MLVYGDHAEAVRPRELLRDLGQELAELAELTSGIERHSRLIGVLIEAGRLLQGVADADFENVGSDRITAPTETLNRWVYQIATAACRSWGTGLAELGCVPPPPDKADLPDEVELRTPEGFGFYAVYPEAYIEAARKLRLAAPPRVIGIRSIGTSLGAVVAAALNAGPAVTARPIGDPFARKLSIGPELERRLLAGDAHFVIVDEGPGQSGSSFGAVADWLEQRGVPRARIALLPSHSGAPGAHASEAHRRRWDEMQREPGDFCDGLPQLLEIWASDLFGPLDQSLREISGGEWRRLRYADEKDWPAAVPAWERRKFIARFRGEPFLVKFAGLGSVGDRKLAMAKSLHSAGLAPEVIGLAHGFLVERWHDEAQPLGATEKPVERIGDYIGTRARLFPAAARDGASLDDLLVMCRRNVSLALGDEFAAAFERWAPRLSDLSRRIARVRTDNRLGRTEWLKLPDGGLLKSDSLDHHGGHDLIGCQDMAWDVAGAIVEFHLDDRDADTLIAAAERSSSRPVDRDLLDFYLLAYRAFRLGQASLGAQMCAANPIEVDRLVHDETIYVTELQQLLLEGSSSATRLESLVD